MIRAIGELEDGSPIILIALTARDVHLLVTHGVIVNVTPAMLNQENTVGWPHVRVIYGATPEDVEESLRNVGPETSTTITRGDRSAGMPGHSIPDAVSLAPRPMKLPWQPMD